MSLYEFIPMLRPVVSRVLVDHEDAVAGNDRHVVAFVRPFPPLDDLRFIRGGAFISPGDSGTAYCGYHS